MNVETGSGEHPDDCDTSQISLSSSHGIRNSNLRDLKTNTLPLGHRGSHDSASSRVGVVKACCFLETINTRAGIAAIIKTLR